MKIDTSQELKELFDDLFLMKREKNFVYRGYSKEDELNSSITKILIAPTTQFPELSDN